MISAFPYQGRGGPVSSAGASLPAGTITPGTINPDLLRKLMGGMPAPQPSSPAPQVNGTGGWPGGFISPTAKSGVQKTTQSGSLASTTAGTTRPAGTITDGTINPELLRKLLGLGGQQQQGMPDWLSSLGLGNFFSPHGAGDAQNAPVIANSTIGGYQPPARTYPPVRRIG